ncbi:MAG: RIP metalloprotease RseP, partial [Bosea sp. (in: a-proteobacteria)]
MDILAALTTIWGFIGGYLLPFLFVLTLVVFIHELGHYLVGRWCGVDVETFSIGFGRELFGWNDRHGTRWRVAAIPLGGYVKFAGDADAASSPDHGAVASMSPEARARSFPAKSVGQRSAIVVAGPVANFILAIVIFAGSAWLIGKDILVPRVEQVVAGSAAERAGFLKGDLITAIGDRKIKSFSEMQRVISTRPGERLSVAVDRDGKAAVLEVTPDLREISSVLGKQRVGMIGIQASRNAGDWKVETYSFSDAVASGFSETWFVVERTFDYLGKLIVGKESTDQLSGPIRIAQASGVVASAGGIAALISLAAVLSVSIGLINLFPIPMLDGGHLVFYAIEALRGRPLSERAQEMGARFGMALVLMLMVFVTWND